MTDKKSYNTDREVHIIREFGAPKELVFNAWADPKLLIKWYAPEGCTIHFKEIRVEAGGRYHSRISNPQYGDCWCIGEYKEVVPHSRLVFTMVNADGNGNPIDPAEIGMDPNWPGETLVTVTFTEENGKTTMELHQTVSQELAQRTGAYPSWLQMLDHVESLLINTLQE
ncbi:SRPBCC family protein [Sinomicrobium oceani]|uniref:SRPBCC family protein n=1 Tax=Sinomicrobium oceani TaxID=1150368 RepID=UPI00227A5BB4|nr:SRPBCC domain-containing protein [Sinomicrobium oceani]